MSSRAALAALLLGCAAVASAGEDAAWEWSLPPGFPVPLVPADNPMNAPKARLGALLFFDDRLSLTGTYSCASCHDPARAYTDGRARARGALGDLHPRNAPTLVNAAYAASLGWLDSGLRTLEAQHRVPLFNEEPVELGFGRVAAERIDALRRDPSIRALAIGAFPGLPAERFDIEQIVAALASYVRTLVFADSPFDRWAYWGEATLSADARAGFALFASPRTGCAECHGGFAFAGPVVSERVPNARAVFHDGIRTPTLRNVAVTAPYMHDGSLATLDDVLAFYSTVGRGKPLALTADDTRELRAFLESLTDRRFGPPGPP